MTQDHLFIIQMYLIVAKYECPINMTRNHGVGDTEPVISLIVE